MNDWQKVYSTEMIYRAEIVKDTLANHNIVAVVIDKKDTAYQLGHYEVHVKTDDVLWAIKLIENDIQFE
ncbi:DUF2007 domain-containing protein [Fulvivirgaceae bacterium BMA12]|uniref:DUF2007 domain-containing protein n=1 Tax=Agaribacillus aureus TaxID=3051825 RepID=A0ABT8LCX3_9BACT|nr:DUF2007 domain-containing protein [Fulvivirgaceae bacterium BMA12]